MYGAINCSIFQWSASLLFTVIMAWTLAPVYVFDTVSSISPPQDKMLFRVQQWKKATEETPTCTQLASRAGCWHSAATRKEPQHSALGNRKADGNPRMSWEVRWEVLFKDSLCFHFTKEWSKRYWFETETILCIPYKKPERRKAEVYA